MVVDRSTFGRMRLVLLLVAVHGLQIPASAAEQQRPVAGGARGVATTQPAPVAVPVAGPAQSSTLPPKRPGIKRVGVGLSGEVASGIKQNLLDLLRGDGTLVDVVELTNKLTPARVAEARMKECDYLLVLETDQAGGGFAGAFDSALKTTQKAIDQSKDLGTTDQQRRDAEERAKSAGSATKEYLPGTTGKIKATYVLSAMPSAASVLKDSKTVDASKFQAFVEALLNDVVTAVLK